MRALELIKLSEE